MIHRRIVRGLTAFWVGIELGFRTQKDLTAPLTYSPNIYIGYQGNYIAPEARACGILGGGIQGNENYIYATFPSRTFLHYQAGYDLISDSPYPGVSFGAHHRLNYAAAPISGYSGIPYTPNLLCNHSSILSGTTSTLQDAGYGVIGGGVHHYMGTYFSGSAANCDNSGILSGADHYVGAPNAVTAGGVGNSLFAIAAANLGGLFNSVHGAYSSVIAGARCAVQRGVNAIVGNGNRNLIMPALIPGSWYLDIGSQSSGTFLLFYNGTQIGPNVYNISAANLTTALEANPSIGAGKVTVTLLAAGKYLIRLDPSVALYQMTGTGNALGLRNLFNLTPGQRYFVDLAGATGGTWRAGYGRKALADQYAQDATADLAFDASAATVQTALENQFSVGAGKVLVTKPAAGQYYVDFDADLTVNGFGLWVNGSGLTGGGSWSYQSGTDPNYSGIFSGFYNALRTVNSFIGGGAFNDIWAAYGVIPGGVSNAIANILSFYSGILSGINNLIGNLAPAPSSVISGGEDNWNNAANTSTGGGKSNRNAGASGTIAGGESGTVSAFAASIGGGLRNTASGQYSNVPGGLDNTASGNYSRSQGREAQATADYSHAIGYKAVARLYGLLTQASGRFASDGDAQTSVGVLRRTSTSTTFGTMTLDGSSQRLVMPDNTTWGLDGVIVSLEPATGDVARYSVSGLVSRRGGTVTLHWQNVTTDYESAGAGGWNAQLVADPGNNAVGVQTRSDGGDSVLSVCRVELTEITAA